MSEKESKNIKATCTEICQYIEENVEVGDMVRLSLGRCYVPGKVITNNEGVLQIDVDSELIKGLSCINVEELKDYLVELEHECKNCTYVLEAEND